MSNPMTVPVNTLADAERGTRHVFLRDMLLQAHIGVYAHEHRGTQRIRVNVDLSVLEGSPDLAEQDELARVVDYEQVANLVRGIVGQGHTKLVETLAERIATATLADSRVVRARVRVEKLDVFADIGSVGVEVERVRNPVPAKPHKLSTVRLDSQ